jgi:hypothetical protein
MAYLPESDGDIILFDIENAIKVIDMCRDNITFPEYPFSYQEGIEVCWKREALDGLKRYLIKNRWDHPILDIIEDYANRMKLFAAETPEGSEVSQMYSVMADTVTDIACYFM